MITIYVVSHKKVDISKYNLADCYQQIRVGHYEKMQKKEISDCIGENIAHKNANYCELTALYWVWKNDNTSRLAGLNHYRRYFSKALVSRKSKYFINELDVNKILTKYDFIVSKKGYFAHGVKESLLDSIFEKDYEVVRNAIEILTPEYLPFFVKEVENSAGNYLFNMFITNKKLFDDYCEWLFKIILYVEDHTDLKGYTVEQARIYGYISERLLGVWISKNGLRVKEMRVINTEEKVGTWWYFREFLRIFKLNALIKNMYFKLSRIVGYVKEKSLL